MTAAVTKTGAVVPFESNAAPHYTRDPVTGMLAALAEIGVVPSDPHAIIADGRLRRFHVEGDRRGTYSGWCVLRHSGGAGGSWRTGASCTWSARSDRRLSRSEQLALRRQLDEARAAAQAEQAARHEAAARRAAAWWGNARPADPGHGYLVTKQIPPGIARQSGDELILPIQDTEGRLRSLQRIAPDGSKRLLSGGAKRGHFIPVVGDPLAAPSVVIGEGFATTMSVHLLGLVPGGAHIAAIDCGNLEPAARAIRRPRPDVRIVIAADDDRQTSGNPGLTAARAAAAAVGAEVLRPAWPHGAPLGLTDFNDLMLLLRQREATHG